MAGGCSRSADRSGKCRRPNYCAFISIRPATKNTFLPSSGIGFQEVGHIVEFDDWKGEVETVYRCFWRRLRRSFLGPCGVASCHFPLNVNVGALGFLSRSLGEVFAWTFFKSDGTTRV